MGSSRRARSERAHTFRQLQAMARETRWLTHFRVYWLAQRRHVACGGALPNDFEPRDGIDAEEYVSPRGCLVFASQSLCAVVPLHRVDSDYEEMYKPSADEGKDEAAADDTTVAVASVTPVPVLPMPDAHRSPTPTMLSHNRPREGVATNDGGLTAKGRFIRDEETGRLILEALVNGEVVRKVCASSSAPPGCCWLTIVLALNPTVRWCSGASTGGTCAIAD